MTESLGDLKAPTSFSERKLAKRTIEGLRSETLSLGELERKKLRLIVNVLGHPETQTLINEGKLTLGIIKPNANLGKNLPVNDQGAADFLMDQIGDKAVFSLSLSLTREQAEEFYAQIREKYARIFTQNGNTVWESIIHYMSSGPLTFILIHDNEGDAVGWWRRQMGNTRADRAEANSIRGKHALVENLPNNLVHGSESKEEARREISVLQHLVTNLSSNAERVARKIPSEKFLREIGCISEDETVISIGRFYDSGMGNESWIYGYEISYSDKKGNLRKKLIKEKNLISSANDLSFKAQLHAKRASQLDSAGVAIPKFYGVRKASLYQEFIRHDRLEEALNTIKKGPDAEAKRLLDQLIYMAKALDRAGFRPIGFLSDLVYDSDTQRFLYIDYGYDLGDKQKGLTDHSVKQLAARFPRFEKYISG